jgi:hypothetical protein
MVSGLGARVSVARGGMGVGRWGTRLRDVRALVAALRSAAGVRQGGRVRLPGGCKVDSPQRNKAAPQVPQKAPACVNRRGGRAGVECVGSAVCLANLLPHKEYMRLVHAQGVAPVSPVCVRLDGQRKQLIG